jgi:hypothetical protein
MQLHYHEMHAELFQYSCEYKFIGKPHFMHSCFKNADTGLGRRSVLRRRAW